MTNPTCIRVTQMINTVMQHTKLTPPGGQDMSGQGRNHGDHHNGASVGLMKPIRDRK